MQCILREKLMAQAMKLAQVSNIYRTESQRFVSAYLLWLEEAANDLSNLRSPISILIQAEKSSLTAVMDGHLPSHIQEGKSLRKIQRAVAAQSLEKVSKEIFTKIEHIDHTFEQMNEKLCHAVAVLASKEPALFTAIQPDQNGVDAIWKAFEKMPETIPMYNYFCAKLSSTDISYLLMDIIQKINSNRA